jgi:hypothetical protein
MKIIEKLEPKISIAIDKLFKKFSNDTIKLSINRLSSMLRSKYEGDKKFAMEALIM